MDASAFDTLLTNTIATAGNLTLSTRQGILQAAILAYSRYMPLMRRFGDAQVAIGASANANALTVATFLSDDRRVSRVYYPGLPSHPDHAIARRQMSGYGGMVCFDLDGRYDRAERVYDRLQVIKRAASLGGIESLISMPVLTSQWGHSDDQLRAAGVTKGMLRLSVGLEDAADLIADLDQALGS